MQIKSGLIVLKRWLKANTGLDCLTFQKTTSANQDCQRQSMVRALFLYGRQSPTALCSCGRERKFSGMSPCTNTDPTRPGPILRTLSNILPQNAIIINFHYFPVDIESPALSHFCTLSCESYIYIEIPSVQGTQAAAQSHAPQRQSRAGRMGWKYGGRGPES